MSAAPIEIVEYEPWMLDQITELFSNQYSVNQADFATKFRSFYEHPFQESKAIRVVAVSGDKVAGFQSFFYWPVALNGHTLNVWQSGNSLVSPLFRGKGVFGKLLNYLDQIPRKIHSTRRYRKSAMRQIREAYQEALHQRIGSNLVGMKTTIKMMKRAV